MSSSAAVKIRAYADLIRIDPAPGARVFLVAGEILVTGGLPHRFRTFFIRLVKYLELLLRPGD